MRPLYTAHAIAIGGRNGHAETDDKNLVIELSSPGSTSKKSSPTTNPEQLFACGYAACFGSAVEVIAKQQNVAVNIVRVEADVILNQNDSGYFISVALNITIPAIDDAIAEKLVQEAHQICPYSKATRGNIDVTLKVNDRSLPQAA